MFKSEIDEDGFTLIELMVAMAMAGIVVSVIYSAYNIQTKIYTEQGKAAEMQQNIRAGIIFMQSEARMAGYLSQDTNDKSCNANPAVGPAVSPGIHTATATTFGFSMDLNDDDDCADDGENVTYALYTSDGIPKLGRNDNTDAQDQQPIAENIENIEFVYIFSPPLIGSPTTKPPTSTPTAAQLDDIVAVQISILARSKTENLKEKIRTAFTLPKPNAWGENTSGGTVWVMPTPPKVPDSYSRRLLTTTINCRNMGLK